MTDTILNPRQTTLKQISKELTDFDFTSFDLIQDKMMLLTYLQSINSRLGGLLRGYGDNNNGTR
jgi:hypothetical protein